MRSGPVKPEDIAAVRRPSQIEEMAGAKGRSGNAFNDAAVHRKSSANADSVKTKTLKNEMDATDCSMVTFLQPFESEFARYRSIEIL